MYFLTITLELFFLRGRAIGIASDAREDWPGNVMDNDVYPGNEAWVISRREYARANCDFQEISNLGLLVTHYFS